MSGIRLRNKAWAVLLMGALLLTAACARGTTPVPATTAGWGVAYATPVPVATTAPGMAYANPHLLVESSWVEANLTSPGMRIVDVRVADRYAVAHIPDAVNLPLSRISVSQPFPNDLPSSSQVEATLGELGIGDDVTRIVLYDENRGMVAARVFWTLEYFGLKDKVAVLNGGFPKWQQEGRATSQATPRVTPAKFTARPREALLITGDALLAHLDDPGLAIVDTRSVNEYIGQDLRGNRKGGHVPGAVNVNWEDTMTPGDAGVWKTASELVAIYADKGVTRENTVVVYCQTGVRAAHSYFTLRLLGYDRVVNYDGSMAEWNNRVDTPVETQPTDEKADPCR